MIASKLFKRIRESVVGLNPAKVFQNTGMGDDNMSTLTTNIKEGDKVRYISDKYSRFMTTGKIYEVTEIHPFGDVFYLIDDEGDETSWEMNFFDCNEYLMFEYANQEKDVTDLIAGLSRTVAENTSELVELRSIVAALEDNASKSNRALEEAEEIIFDTKIERARRRLFG